ncbi:glycosyltransferase [Morganella psychrotolerans]|uniref:Glycosyl transferase family 1 domain-containing protein n=1 Tax=Morganella psychrotolerans TaxID=368603 RepID=A0A1B8HR11_9GAMM|nr:glycosyltransferase [Morganella psychrotolerans]OBU11874.1 hypothetical protein AYY18_18090 [Morganella psychrotolerans]
MKIIAFLGEKFYKKNSTTFYCSSDSYKFIQQSFEKEKIIYSSQLKEYKDEPFTSILHSDKFYEVPFIDSNLNLVKHIINPIKLKKLIHTFDNIIKENSGSIFWVRNPALISILFTMRVMKHQERLISHFCADVKGISSSKYKFIKWILAIIIEKYILFCMKKIELYNDSIIFCTGSILHNRYKNSHYLLDIQTPQNYYPEQDDRENNFFLFVGRIQDDKGIFELLSAFKKYLITEKDKVQKLKFVGSGCDSKKLQQKIHDFGLEKNVDYLGPKNKEELYSLYNNCHCVIVPSKNKYEGFPRVIVESWYFRKPVIVSNVGGISGLAEHNINCILIDNIDVDKITQSLSKITDDIYYASIKTNLEKQTDITSTNYWKNKVIKEVNRKFHHD